MKKRFLTSRIVCLVLVILCVLPTLFGFSASAATVTGKYVDLDSSYVVDDLEELLDKDEFDALILDETMRTDDGSQYLSLIRLIEFGFDAKKEVWDYYGLYVYIYNPSGVPLTSTTNNRIGLQVKRSNGTKSEVAKYPLKLVSFSNDHTLYKYKVNFASTDFALLKAMSSNERVYYTTGIEMQFQGKTSPKEYDISTWFAFQGFNAGFNAKRDQSNDSLKMRYERFETIPIELHPTSWLSDTSDKGEGWKYEISGVYFAIPNYYLKKYGNWDGDEDLRGLYSVKGSYNEYKLNGIVTDSDEVYQTVNGEIKKNGYLYHSPIATSTSNLEFSFISQNVAIERADHFFGETHVTYYADYGFGLDFFVSGADGTKGTISIDRDIRYSAALFESSLEGIAASDILTFFDENKAGCMSVSSKLGADSGRILGYNPYEITAGEKPMQFTRYDYSQVHPFLGWFLKDSRDEIANVEWLQRVDPSFFESFGSNLDAIEETAIANKYYVGVKEADALLKYATSENIKTDLTNGVVGSTVYLMHFAKTDYFTDPIICYDGPNVLSNIKYSGNHYYFERTIFDDFDILEFTFRDMQGTMKSVSAICSPVDITGDLPPADHPDSKPGLPENPDDGLGWDSLKGWAKALMIVGGLLVAAFLFSLAAPILGPLFGWVFGILGKIFGGITKGISSIFSAREKSYDRKRKREVDRQRDADRESTNREREYDSGRKRVVDNQHDEDRNYDRTRRRVTDRQHDEDREATWFLKAREEKRKDREEKRRDEDRTLSWELKIRDEDRKSRDESRRAETYEFTKKERAHDANRKREVERQRDSDRKLSNKLRKRVDERQENAAKRKDAEEARRAEDHERKHRAAREADRKKREMDDLLNAALERTYRETGVKPASAKKGEKK